LLRLVWLCAQQIAQYSTLLRRELPLVPLRIKHRLALILRNTAEVAKRVLHHSLPISRQGRQLPRGLIKLHPLLWAHALNGFSAGKPALPLLLGHAVHLLKLSHQALLVRLRQTLEAWIITQVLFLRRQVPMLI
jgi:hypothetical protein